MMLSPRKLCSLILLASGPCLASVHSPGQRLVQDTTLLPTHRIGTVLHSLSVQAALRATSDPGCEVSQPPRAIATPEPLIDASDPTSKVSVSFVIGTDGQVHSPVILESAGSVEDQAVLETVRAWRYRPATCNAVPSETESRVEFSGR